MKIIPLTHDKKACVKHLCGYSGSLQQMLRQIIHASFAITSAQARCVKQLVWSLLVEANRFGDDGARGTELQDEMHISNLTVAQAKQVRLSVEEAADQHWMIISVYLVKYIGPINRSTSTCTLQAEQILRGVRRRLELSTPKCHLACSLLRYRNEALRNDSSPSASKAHNPLLVHRLHLRDDITSLRRDQRKKNMYSQM